jgi:hypothetical protein
MRFRRCTMSLLDALESMPLTTSMNSSGRLNRDRKNSLCAWLLNRHTAVQSYPTPPILMRL